MGACASCLGRRQPDSIGEIEESCLLFDDPNNMQHYGSFGEQQVTGQNEHVGTQREVEVLQLVVARTSDNMVDIFEITPPRDAQRRAPTIPFGPVDQEARQLRYQLLLSKVSTGHPRLASRTRVNWLLEDEADDTAEPQTGVVQVRSEPSDALVGDFWEAAAAMT